MLENSLLWELCTVCIYINKSYNSCASYPENRGPCEGLLTFLPSKLLLIGNSRGIFYFCYFKRFSYYTSGDVLYKSCYSKDAVFVESKFPRKALWF